MSKVTSTGCTIFATQEEAMDAIGVLDGIISANDPKTVRATELTLRDATDENVWQVAPVDRASLRRRMRRPAENDGESRGDVAYSVNREWVFKGDGGCTLSVIVLPNELARLIPSANRMSLLLTMCHAMEGASAHIACTVTGLTSGDFEKLVKVGFGITCDCTGTVSSDACEFSADVCVGGSHGQPPEWCGPVPAFFKEHESEIGGEIISAELSRVCHGRSSSQCVREWGNVLAEGVTMGEVRLNAYKTFDISGSNSSVASRNMQKNVLKLNSAEVFTAGFLDQCPAIAKAIADAAVIKEWGERWHASAETFGIYLCPLDSLEGETAPDEMVERIQTAGKALGVARPNQQEPDVATPENAMSELDARILAKDEIAAIVHVIYEANDQLAYDITCSEENQFPVSKQEVARLLGKEFQVGFIVGEDVPLALADAVKGLMHFKVNEPKLIVSHLEDTAMTLELAAQLKEMGAGFVYDGTGVVPQEWCQIRKNQVSWGKNSDGTVQLEWNDISAPAYIWDNRHALEGFFAALAYGMLSGTEGVTANHTEAASASMKSFTLGHEDFEATCKVFDLDIPEEKMELLTNLLDRKADCNNEHALHNAASTIIGFCEKSEGLSDLVEACKSWEHMAAVAEIWRAALREACLVISSDSYEQAQNLPARDYSKLADVLGIREKIETYYANL